MKYTVINNPYEIAIGDYILGYKIVRIDYSAAGYIYAESSGGLKTMIPWEFVTYLTNNGEVVREIKEPKPTVMPDWMKKQFDRAERTVATWSDAKCEAAGIPRKSNPTLDEQVAAVRAAYKVVPNKELRETLSAVMESLYQLQDLQDS
jgi:hypothetical protein